MNKALAGLLRKQDWKRVCQSSDWRDGLLIGNGNLAGVAYAPAHLEWVFNKVDLFDPTVEEGLLAKVTPHKKVMDHIRGEKLKNTLFLRDWETAPLERKDTHRSTISAVILRLRFWHGIGWSAPSTPLTSQHLSFYDGILEEKMDAHFFHPEVKMCIPRNREVFCCRIREKENEGRSHIFEMVRPASTLLHEPVWKTRGEVVGFVQQLPGKKYFYSVGVLVVPKNGGSKGKASSPKGNAGEIIQNGDCDLFLSVKCSYSEKDPFDAVCRELEAAAALGYDALEEENKKFWHQYWDNAYADFGKYQEIQKYFTFSLYEIACAYGKAPMPGLNGMAYGPVNGEISGVSCQGYTHDQNVQIPTLAFFPLNRTRFIEVLADTYLAQVKTLRKYTKRLFGCEGIFLPLALNQLCVEYPTRSYRYTLNGSAYSGMVLAKAWKNSRNMTLLREKLYPLMREFALFYSHIMRKGEDGYYHLDYSVPPEIFTLTRDESSTMAMLKCMLEVLAETAPLLGRPGKERELWQELLSHYPPICRTKEGAYWCGPDVPENHYFFGGHILYPYFPAAIVPEDIKGAKATLSLIEKDAIERSFADHKDMWHTNHDWSMFLITATRLRCGEKKEGWKGLFRFLELFGKENGLFSHDPILIGDPAISEENARKNAKKLARGRVFADGELLTDDNPEVPHPMCVTPNKEAKRLAPAVLEGSSAFLFLAAETLLQSHGKVIKPFPAVPEDFTGSFDRFLAEGAFEVSGKMKKGKLLSLKVKSLAGETCQILFPDGRIEELALPKGRTYNYKA